MRRRWREVFAQQTGAPIAVYPAGRHTRWLLETVRVHADGPPVAAVLDDEPGARREIAGIGVRRMADADPRTLAAVVVSSDSIEERLAARAAAWAGSARVIRLYESLPPGPYDGSHDEMFTRLATLAPGTLTEEQVGEFTTVRRLPRVESRSPGQPLPVPPDGARSGYDGRAVDYLSRGRAAAEAILRAARPHLAGSPCSAILEWGCSSGRVLRHMPDLVIGAACWGCDIDAWSINWAAAHLAPPLRLFRSTTTPSLPLETGAFDLVYAVSVFTHLSDHFDAWLMELRRILRPGGVLVATINDERVWARCAAEPGWMLTTLCPRLDFSHPLSDDFVTHGLGPHAQSFWHTQGVRRRWSFALDVLEFLPDLIDGQTGVVLRRPAPPGG